MSRAIITVLPKGSRFLDLLYDLGYLNERLLQKINHRLLNDELSRESFSLDDIRKITAEIIFENLSDLQPESRKMLLKEWKYLFS